MSQSAFKYFGINENDIPILKRTDCEYILEKAQKIVAHRSQNEIASSIKTIHRFHQDSEHFFLTNNIPNNKKVIYSSTLVLKNFMGKFDLTTLPSFPNATWHECFALLAIALIENACQKPLHWKNETLSEKEKEYEQRDFVSDLLIEATEAIDMTNTLLEVEHEHQHGIERISQQSRDAVLTRHDESRKLKCRFVKYFEENNLTNQTKAAKDFYHGLSKEEKIYKYDENNKHAIRTLTKGLRDYRKGKLDCSK